MIFYLTRKNTKITGGGTKEEKELKDRLLTNEIIKEFVKAGTERRLKTIASKVARTTRSLVPRASGSKKGINKSVRSKLNWRILQNAIFDKNKSKNLFLRNNSVKEQIQNRDILELQVEDLIYKETFVKHWKTHFETIVPNLMNIVTSFKNDYVGANKNLHQVFFTQFGIGPVLETQNCVFLALLLNLWTHQGNNWVFNLVIQENLEPQHLGHKYMCSLSLLARYFCNKINKEFFDVNKNKAINVYFGTSSEVAKMLFDPNGRI